MAVSSPAVRGRGRCGLLRGLWRRAYAAVFAVRLAMMLSSAVKFAVMSRRWTVPDIIDVAVADRRATRVVSDEMRSRTEEGNMAVQDVPERSPHPSDDYASETLVGAAAAVLAGARRDIPQDFLAELFGRAVPDDLERYSPEELAGIAEQSWSFLLRAQAGAPKIAFDAASRRTTASPCSKFSTTTCRSWSIRCSASSASAALDIRLLVHPVFTVERDEARQADRLQGHAHGGRPPRKLHPHSCRRRGR